MSSRFWAWTLASALLMGLLTLYFTLPNRSAGAVTTPSGARLDFVVRGGYAKSDYVGGQGLYLVGNIGRSGVRSLTVESRMNRPGDTWTDVDGEVYRGRTSSDGAFRIPIEAPSMFKISYRVRSGTLVTPGVLFDAKTQDVDLWVQGYEDYRYAPQPLEGTSFTIVADTTPDFYRRPTTKDLPVFVGRGLTLFKKTGPSSWETVAETVTDAEGQGRFTGLSPAAGTHVYRVRMEEWYENGSEVGWMPSWPIEVRVRRLLDPIKYQPEGERTPGNIAGQREPEAENFNAGARYNWWPAYWDYAWERGQSLDDPPTKGTKMRGVWRENATGLGRVVKHNGGLLITSGKLVRDGRGDFGTTWGEVRGGASTYGRWEALVSYAQGEEDFKDYDSVIQVVPARAKDYDCGRHNITVARWSGLSRRYSIGVNAGDVKWRRTVKSKGIGYSIPAVAVEVGRGHITWFLNSKPVGTVKSKKAIPRVPLTLRMGLVGGSEEHNNSSFFSDWQRSFPIDRGRQVKSGPGLKKSPLTTCEAR